MSTLLIIAALFAPQHPANLIVGDRCTREITFVTADPVVCSLKEKVMWIEVRRDGIYAIMNRGGGTIKVRSRDVRDFNAAAYPHTTPRCSFSTTATTGASSMELAKLICGPTVNLETLTETSLNSAGFCGSGGKQVCVLHEFAAPQHR